MVVVLMVVMVVALVVGWEEAPENNRLLQHMLLQFHMHPSTAAWKHLEVHFHSV